MNAKQGHHAIARKLAGDATGLINGASGHFKVTVEKKHHVVGKLAFGKRGKATQIGKQYADDFFLGIVVIRQRKRV